MKKNPFIVLEGMDGAGKGTIRDTIVEELKKLGRDFIYTREPGGTPVGEELRKILLFSGENHNEKVTKESETLLMMSSRSQLVTNVIKPHLAKGNGVLSERFVYSTYAYQGARGTDIKDIEAIDNFVLKGFRPDATIFLDVDLETSKRRVGRRDVIDHFEKDADRDFNNVRDIYLSFAKKEPDTFKIVDARLPLEVVQENVRQLVRDIIRDFDLKHDQENEIKKTKKFKPR